LQTKTANTFAQMQANTVSALAQLNANTANLQNSLNLATANNSSITDDLLAELANLRANTVALEASVETISGDVVNNATDTTITDDLQDQIDLLRIADAGKLTKDFVAKDLTVAGDLTVQGSVISTDTETLNVSDNKIVLNSGFTGTTPTLNGIIEVERGDESNQRFLWNESLGGWESDTFLIEAGSKLEDKYASKSDVDDLKANTANSVMLVQKMSREIDGDGNVVWEFG